MVEVTARIEIDPEHFAQTVVGAAIGNGLPEEEYVNNRGKKHLILIAAAPKSGSTFLENVIRALTNLGNFRLASAYSTNEHDLYLPALYIVDKIGCVSKMHMKGTFHNACLLRKFGIKPIILVRGIYDVVASLLADIRKKEQLPHFGSGLNGYSFFWQDETIRKLDDDRLIDLIIDLVIPWYVNFYVSWFRLCERGDVDAIWVTYENMMANKRKTIQEIIGFLGIDNIPEIPDAILNKKYANFHDGRVGRGSVILSDEKRQKVKRLFSYYEDIDFGYYGI